MPFFAHTVAPTPLIIGSVLALRQSLTIGRYLLRQRMHRNDKFPLLVELEPLFQCNLACSFCGKIQYPEHILKKRMPVDHLVLLARDEDGYRNLIRIVSIAGLAVPSFWLGMLVIMGLLTYFDWLPPITFTPFFQDPWTNLSQLIWPAALT